LLLRRYFDFEHSVHFCKDGQHVVSASSDNTVRIWNPTTGKQLSTLRGFPGWVNSTTVSEDQEWLIATSDHIVSVWNFREVLEKASVSNIQKRRERASRIWKAL